MAKLPYRFHTPIPRYFRDKGWLFPENPKGTHVLALLHWAFSRCYIEPHQVYHDGRELTLQSFEFIFGRKKCAEETGLTEDEIRTIVVNLLKAGLIEKTPNSIPKRFSCYKWVTARFAECSPQQNTQVIPNSHPSVPHKRYDQETKESIFIEDVSFGLCGNVHKVTGDNVHDVDNEEYSRYIEEFKFVDGSKINEKVLFRWWSSYGCNEIYKALLYYQKMSATIQIKKDEAYVEKCLKQRYWEIDERRTQCKERENAILQQKELMKND